MNLVLMGDSVHLRGSLVVLAGLFVAASSLTSPVFSQSGIASRSPLSIMPLPAQATPREGAFLLNDGIDVVFRGYREPRLEHARERFFKTLQSETGIRRWPESKDAPRLTVETKAASAAVQQLGEDESYRLDVSTAGVHLTAANPLGVLRGLQTFLQMVHATPKGFVVDSVLIEDKPRFPWRGLMIDSGRHFMPVEIIRQNLDAMEAVKLNVLHWHVSEDQGTRIESKLFPKLTGMGSDGLFYSQQDVRDIIAYARDRGIRVMPEFEMPSHANALYVGYPELADGVGPYHLKRKFGEKWVRERKPSEDSSMDPTQESTYAFLDAFLGEMGALFPDAYLHVGGDAEDAVTEWATNPRIQQYMREHNYKDSTALQLYFTGRLQRIVRKHYKTMVGWDEVLQPDTPKDVVIQSWRGLDSLGTAVKRGNRAILSWGYYLDLNEPASRHYAVDPLVGPTESLSKEEQSRILGGETAMWTEYISPETIDGRIWPRAAVVAERLWSPQQDNDMESMYVRLLRLAQFLTYGGLPFQGTRELTYQRLVGNADPSSLKVLAALVEPPKGFPRETNREYTVYTPLNHLSDVIPAEADRAREFRKLAERISSHTASAADFGEARQSLMVWRDNDAALRPILEQSALTAELVPLSHNLSEIAEIGLGALGVLESGKGLDTAVRDRDLSALKTLGAPVAELTDMVVPGVEMLVKASAVNRAGTD